MAVPLIILAIAAVLRLDCLGCRSLWLDEVVTADIVRQPTIGAALAYAATWTDHTPLHFLLTWILRGLGSDEFAIRLPYAVAGALGAVAMYGLASSLFGRLAGVLGGLLMAVLPFAVYHSQESRPSILLIVLTILLMHAVYRAAVRQRAVDWALLAVVGSLDLYVGYLAITTLVAAYAYVGLVLLTNWIGCARKFGLPEANRSVRSPIVGATVAAMATAAAFLPWANHFAAFLGRPDLGFGRVPTDQPATPGAALALLAQLDLQGLTLALCAVGILTALIRLATGRWREGLLPLVFLLVPLAGILWRAGGGIVLIWPRYFSTLYPPAVLLVGLGMVGLAEAAAAAWRRLDGLAAAGWRPMTARLVVAILLAAPVGAQALSLDFAAYERPKGSDYRGAVDRMVLADSRRPVVIVTGPNPDWVERGLDYYGWAHGSSLRVVDGLRIGQASLADLRAATSLWLATRQMDLPVVEGPVGTTRSDHADFSLFGAPKAPGAGESAARDLLMWAAGSEPELATSVRLIEALEGSRALGPELLPAPASSDPETGPPALERWTRQPGVVVALDGSGFVESPTGGQVNAILATRRLTPGEDYLLEFACLTVGLQGEVRAFVVATGSGATTIFPDGAGEVCGSGTDSGDGLIAFTVPADAHLVTIWLRATGSGDATIGPISLRRLS